MQKVSGFMHKKKGCHLGSRLETESVYLEEDSSST
jgi:hypothetical protein